MTDVAPESVNEDESWEQAAPAAPPVVYPEMPQNPHESPLSVNFTPDKPPMLTVRGRTPAELSALLQGVQESGLLGVIGEAWGAFKAQAAIGAGLGPTTVMQAPQAPAQGFQAATPPPFGPNVSVPQAPGFQGPPQGGFGAPQGGFQQQGGGFGGGNGGGFGGGGQQQGQRKEYPAPQGWYRLSDGARKETVDSVATQAGVPKGNPNKGGHYNFFGLPQKGWYCSPQAAQAFIQFNPVPA